MEPPRASPQPAAPALTDDSDTPTGEYPAASAQPARPRATPDFVKDTVNAAELKMEGAVRRAKTQTISLNMITTLAAVVTAAITAYVFLEREAHAQVDAGVQVVDQRSKETEAALARFQVEVNNRMVRVEHQGDRLETKMDAVLSALQVKNPAPRPVDGGQ